jgi:hypothetical protein
LTTKAQSSNPRPYEAQLEDQKAKKSSKCHLEEGKPQKPTEGTKSGKMAKKS